MNASGYSSNLLASVTVAIREDFGELRFETAAGQGQSPGSQLDRRRVRRAMRERVGVWQTGKWKNASSGGTFTRIDSSRKASLFQPLQLVGARAVDCQTRFESESRYQTA